MIHAKERTQDELPQSASGTTIMTTEPKFVPKEAAGVKLSDDRGSEDTNDRLCRFYGRRSIRPY